MSSPVHSCTYELRHRAVPPGRAPRHDHPTRRPERRAEEEKDMRNGWIDRRSQGLGTFTLARNATLRPGRAVVRVDRGTALVTQAGDLEDHVLSAGAEYRPAARGLVVLWALEDAVVTLAPPGAHAPAAAPAACAA
jgi:hypothetical protein